MTHEALMKTLSVYLVEPSAMQAKIIVADLESLGVSRIRVFDSARDALQSMQEARPDVVISAMYLPDMSGTELAHAIRHEARYDEVAFVLVSSETRPQVLEPIRQSGASGILPKPFSVQQLATVLEATLDYLQGDDELVDQHAELAELAILIVDDSRMSRNYVRHVFENLGMQHFIEAENGLEAVKILAEVPVDLVVTDFHMPEMDGEALVQHIRAKSWQNAVPILMVTGEQDKSRLAGMENYGVAGICDKPFEPRVIKTLLLKMLKAHQIG